MGPEFVPLEDATDANAAECYHMERWAQHVGCGSQDQFRARLQHDRLTHDFARAIAAGVRLQHPENLPSWAGYLDRVIQISHGLQSQTLEQVEAGYDFLKSPEEIGFSHLMVPFVVCATEILDGSTRRQECWVTASALHELQLDLCRALCNAARETLALEFSVWKAASAVTGEGGSAAGNGSAERHLYASFIRMMLHEGLALFFTKYPVLARILAQMTELWVASTQELLARVGHDMADFGVFDPGGLSPGRIVHFRTGLSDRHNGGRTVLGAEFESGLRLIYKNKDPQIQLALDRLLEWLNQNGSPLLLKTFKMVHRESYYWVEEISPRPCEDFGQVVRYYRRSGMLVCLMYFLGGYDFHSENLIACGEHPVIIDSETILHPELRPAAELTNTYPDSVVRTCMLPRRSVQPTPKDYNCGLAHKGTHGHIRTRVRWENPNTDRMKLVRATSQSPLCENVVYRDGAPVPADDHVEDIIDGFREMYALVMRLRERLCGDDGPLSPMGRLNPRFVFRHTATYEKVLRDMLQPQHLRDGIEASIRLDVLSRALLQAPSNARFWPLLAAEHAALCAGDVPMFFHSAKTGTLIVSEGLTVNARPADGYSGFELVRQRLGAMSEAECERQVCEIRRSFQD
jgi:type 2 lantibiotic biosynthesis protein LanM